MTRYARQVAVPEFGALFGRLTQSPGGFVQEEIRVTRGGRQESLLVRMSTVLVSLRHSI